MRHGMMSHSVASGMSGGRRARLRHRGHSSGGAIQLYDDDNDDDNDNDNDNDDDNDDDDDDDDDDERNDDE
jgi:hypothetical protein